MQIGPILGLNQLHLHKWKSKEHSKNQRPNKSFAFGIPLGPI